jgi:hypothetical protein
MSNPISGFSGKRPYHRPTCSLKSIDEVAALLRAKISHPKTAPAAGELPARSGARVLLVEGYDGDLGLIGQTALTPASRPEPPSILKGGALVEFQLADAQDSPGPQTFLLSDLRHRLRGECGLLESIGGIPDFSDATPLVIFVSSMEQFHGWKGIEATHCWQLRAGPSPAELTACLRSFLHLCVRLANRPLQESLAPGKDDKYVSIGKSNKK